MRSASAERGRAVGLYRRRAGGRAAVVLMMPVLDGAAGSREWQAGVEIIYVGRMQCQSRHGGQRS
jgi:hypothetical protein